MSFKTGGLLLLSERVSLLPPSERKIAQFILDNPYDSISLTASELGKRSSTSGAAVMRLCKSLNLEGLQDLRIRVAGDLQKSFEQGLREFEHNENPLSIIQQMTNHTIHTMRETANLLNVEELQKAGQALAKAKTIHFFGIGASSIIVADAQQKFLRIGKVAYSFKDTHLASTLVANANENDVLVGISFSGETQEVVKILELANQRNVCTISLTK
ncbi:MurR/RpiR family transcriptional regulator [Sutcliffiella cohnii]